MIRPRGKESVGSGLAAARPARKIAPGERIHVVGAAGAGASAAALLAHAAGALVSGCDPGGPSPYTPPILAVGIALEWRHDAAHVRGTGGVASAGGAEGAGRSGGSGSGAPEAGRSGGAPGAGGGLAPERLAVTKALTAIDPDNAELVAAREAGIPIEPWQQVIADAAAGRYLVGVAGTHGKSTTSGWLTHVLASAGLDPAACVGALLPPSVTTLGAERGLPSTARLGRGRPFVVEADEYAGNFDPYRPDLAVLTSAEWDHPDVFENRDAVVECFRDWLEKAAEAVREPALVANVGDEGVAEVVAKLRDWEGRLVAVRLVGPDVAGTRGADATTRHYETLIGRLTETGPGGTTLQLDGSLMPGPLSVRLRLAGRHNASNALGVAGAALAMRVPASSVADALGSFDGVGRRLERKGEGRGVVVYDDYGHHPTAIRETLAAIRQLEPGRRVWAVYEPLTYHRTAAMLEDFARVLATADAVAIADIWASRDPDTTVTSAAALAEAVVRVRPGMVAGAPGSVEETAAWLAGRVKPGDAVLVMGGGKSYRIAELLLVALGG
jgi:UDP-N-acetylmuramate--alanine ligase